MKSVLKLAALLVLGTGLAGCDIGEGSTIEKLEIVPAANGRQLKNFEIGDGFKVFQCLRDELLVRATFTDGTEANFSGRVTWSSSDPAIVQVSNGEIDAVLSTGTTDGGYFLSALKYGGGTIIPLGTPGQTATITATFAGLSASIDVEIRKPTLRIVSIPTADPDATVPPFYVAAGTAQRLTVLADLDGRTVQAVDLFGGVTNAFNINPFRWVFTGGTFVPEDPDVDGDIDQWVIDVGADRIVTMNPGGTEALVEGVTADYAPHEVLAESFLCQAGDLALRPVASVQVATLYDDPGTPADDRLILSREAGFTGGGFAFDDQADGTSQRLELRGRVDANGDGSLIVEQDLRSRASFLVEPLNASCLDDNTLLGCSSNEAFQFSNAQLLSVSGTADGKTARVQACTPLCLPAKATLQADDTTVGTGVAVTFTATAVSPPAGVTTHYLFDFGDGTTLGPQASALASHAYATAGFYTATVRLVDAAFPAEFLSQNAGAVRVLAGVTPPANNTAPVAVLTIASELQNAPVTATFTGTNSTDANAGDSITVYEFDPGDGTGPIRQTRGLFTHVYLDDSGSPYTPTLKVYDESGVASAVVNGTGVTVTGTSPELLRSNQLSVRARATTLCSAVVLPAPGAMPTEEAFSFPGLRFDVVGSFVADTDTDTCTDPVIGTQLVTRFVDWFVRPTGVTDELSDVVGIRIGANDYQFAGQTSYFSDVAVDTTFDVNATFFTLTADLEATPTTLTVTPCTTCTP